jgi:hypothetical protein
MFHLKAPLTALLSLLPAFAADGGNAQYLNNEEAASYSAGHRS